MLHPSFNRQWLRKEFGRLGVGRWSQAMQRSALRLLLGAAGDAALTGEQRAAAVAATRLFWVGGCPCVKKRGLGGVDECMQTL